METLNIEKVNALEAHKNATAKGKILLEDLFGKKTFLKDVKERIKSFDDVLIENGISKQDFDRICQGLPAHKIAANKVEEIVKAFNEGWVPDWNNSSEWKYTPYFKMSSSDDGFSCNSCARWSTDSSVGSRLCFKSSDLAKHCANLFLDIYRDFLTA